MKNLLKRLLGCRCDWDDILDAKRNYDRAADELRRAVETRIAQFISSTDTHDLHFRQPAEEIYELAPLVRPAGNRLGADGNTVYLIDSVRNEGTVDEPVIRYHAVDTTEGKVTEFDSNELRVEDIYTVLSFVDVLFRSEECHIIDDNYFVLKK